MATFQLMLAVVFSSLLDCCWLS